ncbi:MAG: hypothetical protein Q4B15_02185 [Lachnospiraceae bacterium]|nr:hypothetical protein [Lachnospiraceae bacterium]
MTAWQIVLTVILVVAIAAIIVLYFVGRKLQKRQVEQQEQLEAAQQNITLMAIDKKRMRLKDAGLPQMVMDQTNFMTKRAKVPVVKAKIGPRIMTLIADESVFEIIPINKEVKATVSGIYITRVKALRGSLPQPQKKKNWRQRLADRARKTTNEAVEAERQANKKKKK